MAELIGTAIPASLMQSPLPGIVIIPALLLESSIKPELHVTKLVTYQTSLDDWIKCQANLYNT